MIELFALKYLNKKEKFDENNKVIIIDNRNNSQEVIEFIISLIVSVYAAYIAYNCNLGESTPVRFLITLFAFLFGIIYLIYYFVIYFMLKSKCSK